MNRLPLLPLAVPFACLALLSLVGFLGGSLSLARSMWSGQSSRDWASKVQMATRGRGWSATRIRSITLRHRAKRSSRKWRRGNGFEPPSRAVHTRALPIELPCHSLGRPLLVLCLACFAVPIGAAYSEYFSK